MHTLTDVTSKGERPELFGIVYKMMTYICLRSTIEYTGTGKQR